MLVFPASDKYVRQIGRTYFSGGALWCASSGTGIEFTANGKECLLTLIANPHDQEPNLAGIAVFVNGKRVIDTLLREEKQVISIFKYDKPQNVTVRVTKLTEAAFSLVAIKKITLDGTEIKSTRAHDKLIEFIGDSITCGFGVKAEGKQGDFATADMDVTKTYAYKCAEKLGTEYSMLCASGFGVVSGYTATGIRNPIETLPQYYESLGFSYGNFGAIKPQEIKWDFRLIPDIIVINLGTNDDSFCQDDEQKQAKFRDEYAKFLAMIRKNNPSSTIVCTLGIMGPRLFPWLEAAVELHKKDFPESKIYTFSYDEQLAEDGFAADWHPTERTHEKAAEKLSIYLKKIL